MVSTPAGGTEYVVPDGVKIPCHLACENGHAEEVKLLQHRGATFTAVISQMPALLQITCKVI